MFSFRTPSIPVDADTTPAMTKMSNIQREADKLDAKIGQSKMKITQYWTYGMTLSNLISTTIQQSLSNSLMAAKAAKANAFLNFVNAEFAIALTMTQAYVYAITNPFAAGLMYTTAIMLQTNLGVAQINKHNAALNEAQIQQYNNQVEIWSNSYS